MKRFLLLAAVFGATVFAANKLMAQGPKKTSELNEDTNDDQETLQERFNKLGKQIKEKLSDAEDDLKNANDKTRAEMQKAVDALKKQGREVEKASGKIADKAQNNWDSVKKELGDLASKLEKDLSK